MRMLGGVILPWRGVGRPWFGAAPAMVNVEAAELRLSEGMRKQNRRVGKKRKKSKTNLELVEVC
jgi:hypothetical protein